METIQDAHKKAKEKFVSDRVVLRVQVAVGAAIDEVDVGFTDLFSKEELADRYQRNISANAGDTLKKMFEEAMDVFGEHIRKKLEDAVKEFLGQMNRQGIYIDQNHLSEQIRQSMGNVGGEVAGSLTVLIGGIVMSIVGSLLMVETTKILFITIASTINPVMLTIAIVGALASLVTGMKLFSVKDRVSNKLKESIVPKFNKDKMNVIWTESTGRLIHTTFDAIWFGRDPNGNPLYINGKYFKGLEFLIRENA